MSHNHGCTEDEGSAESLRVGSSRDSWRKNVQSGQPKKSPDVMCSARSYLLRRFGYTLKRGRERDRADEEDSDDVLEIGDVSGSIWRVTSARRKIWIAMIRVSLRGEDETEGKSDVRTYFFLQ